MTGDFSVIGLNDAFCIRLAVRYLPHGELQSQATVTPLSLKVNGPPTGPRLFLRDALTLGCLSSPVDKARLRPLGSFFLVSALVSTAPTV